MKPPSPNGAWCRLVIGLSLAVGLACTLFAGLGWDQQLTTLVAIAVGLASWMLILNSYRQLRYTHGYQADQLLEVIAGMVLSPIALAIGFHACNLALGGFLFAAGMIVMSDGFGRMRKWGETHGFG